MPVGRRTPEKSGGRVVSFNRGDGAKIIRADEKQRITLMMLSGGFDSTYFLYKLLTETDDFIVAHHINLVNPERRHEEELKACRAIVAWLRAHTRPFEYGESTIGHENLHVFGFDMISVGFEAGIVARSIYSGYGRMPDRWMLASCTEEGGNPERWVHVENCVAANCYPAPPPPFDSLRVVTKAEEIAFLPAELRERVWYCRRPIHEGAERRVCGECKTCLVVEEARAELALEKTK